LFTKYVALFVAVVCIALVSNGVFDVLFYYQEHKASLIRIQREQAEAAAAKIGQFIKEIESQLGWTTQLPWSAGSISPSAAALVHAASWNVASISSLQTIRTPTS
jgi:two-component system, NtrC family, sensor kinase